MKNTVPVPHGVNAMCRNKEKEILSVCYCALVLSLVQQNLQNPEKKVQNSSDNFIFCCFLGIALTRQDSILCYAINILQIPIQEPLLVF